MIWGEDFIRERVRVGVAAARGGDPKPITFQEAESLIDEVDRLRAALKKAKGRTWSGGVHRVVDEALA